MPKHFISKKEAKELQKKLEDLNIDIGKLDKIEVDEIKGEKCFFVDKKPYVYEKDKVVPLLFLLNDFKPSRKYVTVDDGAVPHIMNGANVFAQGILEMDSDIAKDDMVFVKNKNNVFIAVGFAERDALHIMEEKKGEAIRLVHYPNDKIFKTFNK